MDANTRKALKARIKEVLKKLETNNMSAAYVNNKDEALSLIKSIIPKGSFTASGGSMTLKECGIKEYIEKETDYHTEHRDAYDAEFYLSSANAITEHGEIYQVDGRSNRISAISYGPKHVVIVAGYNKLVPDLKGAIERVKRLSAPANAIRLCQDTPCAKTGICVSKYADERNLGAGGCSSDERICCNTLIMSKQREKGRVIVIIIGEEYGY